MAHELTIRANGKVEMAYVGNIPWHTLGEQLQPGASIEEWITASGMDWRIQRARVRYAVERETAGDVSTYREFDGRVVLLRSDSKDPLGVVSDEYQPVQPKQVLEFFRDLTESAGMTLETAGTMFGGKRFWALAKLGEETALSDPRDKLKAHLLLSTACDGSRATEGRFCTTRVVCNNTLYMAQSEGAPNVKINHRTKFDATAVQKELGIESAISAFDRTIAEMKKLAEMPVSDRGMVALTASLLKPDFATLDSKDKQRVLNGKPMAEIGRRAIDGTAIGSDMDGAKGTAYGWLNSVTEYVDHAARAQTVDNRLNSAWFGKGAELKERAYSLAQSYLPSLDELISLTNETMAQTAAAKTTGNALLDAVLEETIL